MLVEAVSDLTVLNFKSLILHKYPNLRITPKSFFLEGTKRRKAISELSSFLLEEFKDLAWTNEDVMQAAPHFAEIVTKVEKVLTAPESPSPSFELPFDVDPEAASIGEILDEYEPVVDILSGRYGLCRKGEDTVAPIDFALYREQLSSKEWKEIVRYIPQTVFVYDTRSDYDKSKAVAIDNKMLKRYPVRNTYIPPAWLHCDNKRTDLHEDHRKMIETRFADAESLERYYCVLYHMLTDRNKNLCGLVHKREGTGKSTVMGKIPGHLVGMENTSYTDKNFMTTPHKDIFFNKRMIFLDEHKLKANQASIEKQFVEDMLYVNPKGKAAVTIPNVISFFMTSNEEKDIYTEPTNRRHYFLEDSGKHIIEEFGVDFVKSYNERLSNDVEFVANLGYFVLNNFKDYKYPADAIYRGPTFERIVKATCFPFYRDIMELMDQERGEPENVRSEISYTAMKKKFQKTSNTRSHFPNVENFCSFFDNFRWQGERVYDVRRLSDSDAELTFAE